ncbi:MAG: hypothetical protein ACKVT1_04370 [Dehalococcoidia bacterium]
MNGRFIDVEATALAVARRLDECGIPHALGGALAYNYYGVPRATGDVDFNVFLSVEDGRRTLECLTDLGISVSPPVLAQLDREWQVRVDLDGRFVDLFFAYHPFHQSCRERATRRPFGDGDVAVLSAEDLVVFKTIFNRTRDWADIERLFQVQGTRFDIAYALRWLDDILGPDDSSRMRLANLYGGATGATSPTP